MKLYGTASCPYTRALRIVARLHGVTPTFIDTGRTLGDYALREKNPLWETPTLEVNHLAYWGISEAVGMLLSHLPEVDELHRPSTPERQRASVQQIHVAQVAFEALRNAYEIYSLGITTNAVLEAWEARGRRGLEWLEDNLDRTSQSRSFNPEGKLGVSECLVYTVLDWLREREAYPVDVHARLERFSAAWANEPAIVETRERT
ncbi:MAG: glutathione S-transferase family protein [Myxococcales bacterium]|nr:glutathione S-transferase family protein [Myxococcales bacterium]